MKVNLCNMSDVMRFVRELFDGKPMDMAVKATVLHGLRITGNSPAVFELEVDIGGFSYFTIAFTHNPEWTDKSFIDGDEVLLSIPESNEEGFPIFLRMEEVQSVEQTMEDSEQELDVVDDNPVEEPVDKTKEPVV